MYTIGPIKLWPPVIGMMSGYGLTPDASATERRMRKAGHRGQGLGRTRPVEFVKANTLRCNP